MKADTVVSAASWLRTRGDVGLAPVGRHGETAARAIGGRPGAVRALRLRPDGGARLDGRVQPGGRDWRAAGGAAPPPRPSAPAGCSCSGRGTSERAELTDCAASAGSVLPLVGEGAPRRRTMGWGVTSAPLPPAWSATCGNVAENASSDSVSQLSPLSGSLSRHDSASISSSSSSSRPSISGGGGGAPSGGPGATAAASSSAVATAASSAST